MSTPTATYPDKCMVPFEKWQGLGNDFVLVEAEVAPELVARMCDRRRGIGADGVLWIAGSESDSPRMVVRNADGSRPEMCGNGLRCVASYLAERREWSNGELTVQTDAGLKRCVIQQQENGAGLYSVSVDMGCAQHDGTGEWAEAPGHTFMLVDMGNPHAVSFDSFEEADLQPIGMALQQRVEGGVNVELCRVDAAAKRIDVWVWERGVGATQACGTGACAVAAAAAKAGLVPYDEAIAIVLPGGTLHITAASTDHAVTMRGPAARSFRGSWG